MNPIDPSICHSPIDTAANTAQSTRAANDRRSSRGCAAGDRTGFAMTILAASLLLASGAGVQAQPTGGVVSAGAAVIGGTASGMVITQTTPNVAINWQSFGIPVGNSVQFVQPGTNAVALNRVIGGEPSAIFGSLSSNGKVFLVNPNGIVFGQGASVNVGGLVASTLTITDADFMANNLKFSGGGAGTVVNRGTIHAANGGYVALLGASVSNQGVISARLGTVALAAGNAVTLDMAGDRLLNVTVDQGVVNALVDNGGMIRADGGQVLMTTQAAGSLLNGAVNNTGLVQAQTVENSRGTIKLLAGLHNASIDVGGTLDASAPGGGDGGFIETSAAYVKVRDGASIVTAAAKGSAGHWLIDPQDFTVGGNATDNISGATLSALLVTNSVTISTDTGPDATVAGTPPRTSLNSATPGNGDIHINQAVSWSASSSPTTLTLNAARDVNINAAISATNGNLAACCGRDVNVNAPITTVRGSVLLSGGRDIRMSAAMTTTDGNIAMCAARDIYVSGKLTLTRGTGVPGHSLDLPLGLWLSAGYGAGEPGAAGGTVVFAPLAPAMTVTGPNAPVTIDYNPVSYAVPTDYSGRFILSGAAAVTQRMLLFPGGADKEFDGTTATRLSSLQGNPGGVTLVAGLASAADFGDAQVGTRKRVTYTGYSIEGPDAARYVLASSCCAPAVNATSGTITAVGAAPIPVTPVLPLEPGSPAEPGVSGTPGFTGVAGVTQAGRSTAAFGVASVGTPAFGIIAGTQSPTAVGQARSFSQSPTEPFAPAVPAEQLALNVVAQPAAATELRVVPRPETIQPVPGIAPARALPPPYSAPRRAPKQDRH